MYTNVHQHVKFVTFIYLLSSTNFTIEGKKPSNSKGKTKNIKNLPRFLFYFLFNAIFSLICWKN